MSTSAIHVARELVMSSSIPEILIKLSLRAWCAESLASLSRSLRAESLNFSTVSRGGICSVGGYSTSRELRCPFKSGENENVSLVAMSRTLVRPWSEMRYGCRGSRRVGFTRRKTRAAVPHSDRTGVVVSEVGFVTGTAAMTGRTLDWSMRARTASPIC